MSKATLNPKILRQISQNSNDIELNKFIKQLLIIESEKTGNWWWNQTYKKILEEHCKGEEIKNENS